MELYGVGRKKRQVMPFAGIFMMAMAAGSYLGFCNAFAYPDDYREIYLAIIIFSVLFTLTGICHGILKNILYAGYTLAFGIYAVLKADCLQEDINVLYSYIMVKKQQYISGEILNISDILGSTQFENSGKMAIIIIMGIFLLMMSVCIFSLKSRVWSYFPAAAVVSLGMLYGKTPSVKSCMLLIVGTVGIAFSITNRKMEKRNKVIGYIIVFAVMGFCVTVAFFAERMTGEEVLSNNPYVLMKQYQYEEKAKNIVLNIVEEIQNVGSSGRMSNISPVYTGKNIFSVTLDKRPKSNIYFKEFSADTYQNNRWTSNADDSEFYSYRIKSIFSYGYRSARSMSNEKDDFTLMNMQIKYDNKAGNGGQKLSLPYFSNLFEINTKASSDAENSRTLDNAIKLNDSERSITRKADRYYIKYYDVSSMGYNALLNSDESIIKDISYAQYVEDNYLIVPDDKRLKKFADGISFNDEMGTQCDLIKEALQYDTEYTTSPGVLPFGKDYLDYFLFENKKGYCEHFATASTLLLRLKDIPARYVSGYMISPEQFKMVTKKDKNGKVIKRYYAAQVHDNDAHAWSEVYKEGIGWIPVDMTKASSESKGHDDVEDTPEPTEDYDLNKDKNKNNADIEEASSEPEKNDTVKNKKDKNKKDQKSDNNAMKKDNAKDKRSAVKKDKDETGKDKKGRTSEKVTIKIPVYVKVILLVLLVIAVLIGYMVWGRRKLFYLLYKREIKKAADNSEMLFVSRRYLAKYMGAYGRRLEKLSDEEYIETLSQLCDIGRLGDILQKAAFSADDISESELLCCIEIMNKIALKIKSEKSLHCLGFELNLLQNFVIEKTK